MSKTEQEISNKFGEDSERLRALLRRVRNQAEEEKSRLSQEIHDGLSQKLSELSMRVWLLDDVLKESGPSSENQEMSRELIDLVERIIADTVKLEASIAPRILQFGLFAAIESLCEEFQKKTGVTTELSTKGSDGAVNRSTALECYRIIEHLLDNVRRHAGASRVQIQLHSHSEPSELAVVFKDNGVGITPEQWNDSLGLLELRERVRELNGRICLETQGDGTTVDFRIPLSDTGH